ncbi:unnamed protein product [Notodromas monacha]|uniref:Uncharacterized protein n=1 Tax=Notodromas monacha TaxID=399045 RepID=A0A7R9GJL0_9CRUS|nr:unnamed protein product [Notodromas monacha]CAG0923785.1 unnamed protein product [Notodromas monacha]
MKLIALMLLVVAISDFQLEVLTSVKGMPHDVQKRQASKCEEEEVDLCLPVCTRCPTTPSTTPNTEGKKKKKMKASMMSIAAFLARDHLFAAPFIPVRNNWQGVPIRSSKDVCCGV